MFAFDDNLGNIVLHFDTKDHVIDLDTFFRTTAAVEVIAEGIAYEVFGPFSEIEIYVLPAEEGSFLAILRVILVKGCIGVAGFLGAGAAVVTISESDFVSGYIEAKTGKTIEQLGFEFGIAEETSFDKLKQEKMSEEFLVALLESILAGDNKAIEEICDLLTDDVLRARADFYRACYSNTHISGIGFTVDEKFPVPRSEFFSRSQLVIRDSTDPELPEWLVSTENIQVTSPQWDVKDQRSRHWKGRDSDNNVCYFVIEDDRFWFMVKMRDLHTQVGDNLKVQWAYRCVNGKIVDRKVLRVLSFNGIYISEPFDSNDLEKILGKYEAVNQEGRQLGLRW